MNAEAAMSRTCLLLTNETGPERMARSPEGEVLVADIAREHRYADADKVRHLFTVAVDPKPGKQVPRQHNADHQRLEHPEDVDPHEPAELADRPLRTRAEHEQAAEQVGGRDADAVCEHDRRRVVDEVAESDPGQEVDQGGKAADHEKTRELRGEKLVSKHFHRRLWRVACQPGRFRKSSGLRGSSRRYPP